MLVICLMNINEIGLFGFNMVFIKKFFNCSSFLGVVDEFIIFCIRILFFLRGKF